MAVRIKLGMWGGRGGDRFDIDGHPQRLAKIVIRTGAAIHSLGFDYVQDGRTITAGPWGGSGGKVTQIEFEPGEYLTAISGTTGPFENFKNILRSLTFVTNKHTYKPLGVQEGTPFSIPIEHGRIVAFYGRTGKYVEAIGIYVMAK